MFARRGTAPGLSAGIKAVMRSTLGSGVEGGVSGGSVKRGEDQDCRACFAS